MNINIDVAQELRDAIHVDWGTVSQTKNLKIVGRVPTLIAHSTDSISQWQIWWPVIFTDKVTNEEFNQWVHLKDDGRLARMDALPEVRDYWT